MRKLMLGLIPFALTVLAIAAVASPPAAPAPPGPLDFLTVGIAVASAILLVGCRGRSRVIQFGILGAGIYLGLGVGVLLAPTTHFAWTPWVVAGVFAALLVTGEISVNEGRPDLMIAALIVSVATTVALMTSDWSGRSVHIGAPPSDIGRLVF